MEKNQNVQQCFLVSKQAFFTYSSRAGISPSDFLLALKLDESDEHKKTNSYILDRKQYTAMLYKAGVLKVLSELTDDEHAVIGKVSTTDLIQELERRTRKS